MIGKIYFFIVAGLFILGLIYQSAVSRGLDLWELLGISLNGLSLLGLYSYIFQRKMFSKKVWKIIFWALIAKILVDLLNQILPRLMKLQYAFYEDKVLMQEFMIGFIVFLLLSAPSYFAVYTLVYPAPKK